MDDGRRREDPTILGEPDDPFEAALREVGRLDSDEVEAIGGDPADLETDPGSAEHSGRGSSAATDPGTRGPPEDMLVRLFILEGPGRGGSIEVPHLRTVVLGRSSRCEIPLRDLSVSRRHAELRWEAGRGYRVRDLGSRNGCAVDNERIDGWVDVASGQVIAIGDLRLRLEYEALKEQTFIREEPALTPAAPLYRPDDQRPPRPATGAAAEPPPAAPAVAARPARSPPPPRP
ncbi:MAG: FHA domain-containing protein, partial [Deltaproteobacteria bacterium]|nr:FHA domain-containing protein [Deltaproteobacteria bacterium]